ncbi:50S ribosomal protein L28, partial [Dysosmobacter welbionis]
RGSGAGSAPGHCRVPDPGLAVDLRRDPGYGRSAAAAAAALPARGAGTGGQRASEVLFHPMGPP